MTKKRSTTFQKALDDLKNVDVKYEIVAQDTFTVFNGQKQPAASERWPGYTIVRQSRSGGGSCGFVGALIKETPKLYHFTTEIDFDNPFHVMRRGKKERFHISPCPSCQDYD